MRINYKFHAIAISTISAIIVLGYALFATPVKEEEAKVLAPTDTYVRVVSATWGRNCNEAITSAIRAREVAGLAKDEKGNVIPMPVLKTVQTNNVLSVVDALCSKKVRCDLRPDTETMGADPMPDCFKKLEATFRCSDIDRARNAVEGKSGEVTLDCSNITAPNASPTPAQ
jgi:hypothetical protein